MENITDKIMEAIKDEKPKSKWKFTVHEWLMWSSVVLSVVVGSLAVSVILYMVFNNNWALGREISGSFIKFLFLTLPYLWILILVLLVLAAYYNLRHTKHGYKYQLLTLVMGTLLVSIVLGLVFYISGFGQIIDRNFSERLSIYERFASPHRMIWSQVDDGRLSGQVISVRSDRLNLLDVRQKDWVVELDDDTFLSVVPFEGGFIKVMGERIGNDQFKAYRILPFDNNMHNKMLKESINIYQFKR